MTDRAMSGANYNTTKMVTTDKPEIINHREHKFDTLLFLPAGEARKGEGGLRKRGFFKHGYKLNMEDNHWYLCDTDGNLVKPAPQEVQETITAYLGSLLQIEKGNITNLPLITVITVVLNGEKYLDQTIRSVTNQTYPNVEYIIIDGGSTDGTLDTIRKYEDYIDYWVSEKDGGIYDAMNKGIRLAMGEWIGILGSDDFYERNALHDLIFPVIAGNKCSVVYGNSKVFYKNDFLYSRKTTSDVDKIKRSFIFIHPDSMAKLSLYKSIGLYDSSFKLAGDYELFLRAYFNNYKFKKVESIIVNFRLEGFSFNYRVALNERVRLYKLYNLGPLFLIMGFYEFFKGFIKNKLRKHTYILKKTYSIVKVSFRS